MARIESVDAFRVFSIISIIMIHTSTFSYVGWENSQELTLPIIISNGSRYAVPFFFIVSGYFWGLKIENGEVTGVSKNMLRRIGILLSTWSVVYIVPFGKFDFSNFHLILFSKIVYWNLLTILKTPVNIFFEGTKTHLWFLVSLMYCVAISGFLVYKKRPYILITLSLLLYVFGILGKSYSDTPIGIHLSFNTRYGPFFLV